MSNLIPVPRKEQYLSKIDGMTNKSPDKTYTKEEYFFSEILGEALHKPVLETRYEMYLAKIAGREIGIPYPETRLERFLAKAAGMNISVPTPTTREEMYWSTYSPFYLSNSSGTSPLTYGKCKIGTLSNYQIYGNTVSGESVGDRTANLFDAEIVQGSFLANNGAFRDATNRIRSNESDFIYLTTGTYTINADGVDDVVYYAYSSEDTSTFLYYLSMTSWRSLPHTFTVQTPCYFLFGFRLSDESDIIPSDISNIMLNAGSTPLPYEPYGYKVPVTVSDGTDTLTTNLYLPEQIRKVGDEAEYISYADQKLHRVGADDIDVTLPSLPTLVGTNVLSVSTEVQPSHVFVEFYKEREYG